MLSGCTDEAVHPSFVATPAQPCVMDDGAPAGLRRAARLTAITLRQQPVGRATRTTADLSVLAALSSQDVCRFVTSRCRWFRADEPARVTAYYEPHLAARPQRDERFRYPLYRLPGDATMAALRERLGRTPTRADIDGGSALDGLGLEIAWLEDPVERFFLHVQGSGRLVMSDGAVLAAAYAGNNGAEYRSVGSVMLQRGILQRGKASASAMRAWLSAADPPERDELLFQNPRYVFFTLRERARRRGPTGSLGVPLVPGRSVATDPAFVPPGSLLFLRTRRPLVDDAGALAGWEPLERFVFSHDSGAAIKGPARVDLYQGSGARAGAEAGYMNETGELFLLQCR